MTFHPEAAKNYDALAQQLLGEVQGFGKGPLHRSTQGQPDLYVSHVFTEEQILATPRFVFAHDSNGDPSGVVWSSQGNLVGWQGQSFTRITGLAYRMVHKGPARALVSEEFALNVVCAWLRDTLERQRSDALSSHFAEECASAVREHEIWIPLFRTYCASEVRIGAVTFRTISKALMDEWQTRRLAAGAEPAQTERVINSLRAKWQGSLAACTRLTAERTKASELALARAKNATALLSFLSPANWHARRTNFGTLLGSEVLGSTTELTIKDGLLETVEQRANDMRDADWHVDRSARAHPWVLPALDNLASHHGTEFQQHLSDALMLYSRQAHAKELSDKLVFALAALESMLLRDANEPIQKNLGERMAFLVGTSIAERKEIVKTTEDVYKVRSAFVHHGVAPSHQQVLDRFLVLTWKTFAELLRRRDTYKTKFALVAALEDRKMS